MYIQLVSVHGLVRGENIEMGRDADTGGQVRYVLEMARTLAAQPEVDGVDLFTRRIKDKRYSSDYGETIEELAPGCRLVRLPCGGGRYMRKERLWPHLDEFVDEMLVFTRKDGRTPTVVHGHYADAAYVANEVATALGVPFVYTGHSLGKPKLEYLLREGWTHEKANDELAIDRRIAVEQESLDAADLVVTSTRHERDVQYADYRRDETLKVEVIPPGTDLDRFFPYYEYDIAGGEIDERFKQARMRMHHELGRFLYSPEKPLILALCRPDRRKNIGALIDAYGESKELQAIANLAIFAGIREDIESMPENEQRVLTDMLLAMDRYNLYGKMAIPKNHGSEYDVPELYRLVAAGGGVFANTAYIELFGLTAIEATAVGLPFVATQEGGPQDIVENCRSGATVDVTDRAELTDALVQSLTDRKLWEQRSSDGVNLVRKHYAWETHCRHYLKAIEEVLQDGREPAQSPGRRGPSVGRRLAEVEHLLITDIDNTLLGDDEALAQLLELLHENRDRIGFGVATGRSPELVEEVLAEYGVEEIDVIISSVGTEVSYGRRFASDRGWASHLRSRWRPDRVREALDPLGFVSLQEGVGSQSEFKVSYDLDEGVAAEEAIRLVRESLDSVRLGYSLVFSHGTYIDVLPLRASKGKAVHYVANKWGVPIDRVLTAGDSGNDIDMLKGATAGIVVSNHDDQVAAWRRNKSDRVYIADRPSAGGIIDGLSHYGVLHAKNYAEV
ncbi:Mannosylfructose-phosphate synthase [Pseudobythopirellula maris]|uniref:sucrose-phosphate synthase n=1 Tax=Pseudobythopirellula maris TaxID=2527991 RepID=A0A5C5ZRF5_9BACT|nr:HAD-IIB family hydrolase [Pseudobythopirellula maris]TWT90132.1 Mannosylfructose-phosphate synthase [Pseudobythopirellula maris]